MVVGGGGGVVGGGVVEGLASGKSCLPGLGRLIASGNMADPACFLVAVGGGRGVVLGGGGIVLGRGAALHNHEWKG